MREYIILQFNGLKESLIGMQVMRYTLVASEKVEELRVNQIIIPINKYNPLAS